MKRFKFTYVGPHGIERQRVLFTRNVLNTIVDACNERDWPNEVEVLR